MLDIRTLFFHVSSPIPLWPHRRKPSITQTFDFDCKFTDRARKTSELWIIKKYLYAPIEKWFRVCECGVYCCRHQLSVNETWRYLTKWKGARPQWGAGRVSPLLTFKLFVLTNLFRYYLFKSLCVFFQHIVISFGHQWKESKMNISIWEIQHEKNMKFIIFSSSR